MINRARAAIYITMGISIIETYATLTALSLHNAPWTYGLLGLQMLTWIAGLGLVAHLKRFWSNCVFCGKTIHFKYPTLAPRFAHMHGSCINALNQK